MLTRDERSPTYGQEHVEGNVSDFIESTFASRYVVSLHGGAMMGEGAGVRAVVSIL